MDGSLPSLRAAVNAPIATIRMSEDSGQYYGVAQKTAEERYQRLAKEARRWFVGPMPIAEFLDTFLCRQSVETEGCPPEKDAFQLVGDVLGKKVRGDQKDEEGGKGGGRKKSGRKQRKGGAKGEKLIYGPLVRTHPVVAWPPIVTQLIYKVSSLNSAPERCPGFAFYDTHDWADNSGPGGTLGSCKPDICCYAKEHAPLVKDVAANTSSVAPGVPASAPSASSSAEPPIGLPVETTHGNSEVNTPPLPSPRSEHLYKYADMGFVAFYFEVKSDHTADFFEDPPASPKSVHADYSFVKKSTRKRDADLGQAVNYALEVCRRQHRHCCFSISVSGSTARFIRWDRAGAVVSQSFDYTTNPEHLCSFLWCFAKLSNVHRGYDLTVDPATSDEELLFKRTIEEHIKWQLGPNDADLKKCKEALEDHYQKNAVTVIHLEHHGQFISLLISRPIAVPLSMAGRGTRTYWAVLIRANQTQTARVVCLKDTWRYGTLEKEGDIICELNKRRVNNVPKLVAQEDVPEVRVEGDEVRLLNSKFYPLLLKLSADNVIVCSCPDNANAELLGCQLGA